MDVKNKTRSPKDLGFGTLAKSNNAKLINKDGSFNVRRKGLKFKDSFHFYHYLITAPIWKFSLIIFLYFGIVNIIFTSIFLIIGTNHIGGIIANNKWERLYETFFFSAQTLTTVGYGRINPVGFSASFVASLESLIGLMGFAIITGLLYGRFSMPGTNILFSNNIIIAPYQNKNALMFRMANLRKSQLIETEVQLVIAYNKKENDKQQRVFINLELERYKINFFPLTWTVVHPIDENSVLNNMSINDIIESQTEFTVLVKAFDDTFNQQVYSRYSYTHHDVVNGAKFILTHNAANDGVIEIDFEKFHKYENATLN